MLCSELFVLFCICVCFLPKCKTCETERTLTRNTVENDHCKCHLNYSINVVVVFFCLRVPKVVPADLAWLKSHPALAGTPLSYILTPDAPLVQTPLGPVQVGSALAHQVSHQMTQDTVCLLGTLNVVYNNFSILSEQTTLLTGTSGGSSVLSCIS